jgi:hypothetical protein
MRVSFFIVRIRGPPVNEKDAKDPICNGLETGRRAAWDALPLSPGGLPEW